jgi:hypothetical protein
MAKTRMRRSQANDSHRAKLAEFYGADKAAQIKYVEAFEICEYGRRPSKEDIKKLFPFFD